MHVSPRHDSQAIFRQLGEVKEPNAVHTLIENHDAVLHNDVALSQLNALTRARLDSQARSPEVAARIARQRAALRPLVVSLSQMQLRAG